MTRFALKSTKGFEVLAIMLLVLTVCSPAAASTDFYVSPKGNNDNPGTSAKPWKTIQKAANSATPGSTVHVLAGTYPELVTINVSGNAKQGQITFQGETGTILDYNGKTIDQQDFVAAFVIKNQSFVTIAGFEIRNYVAHSASATPVGILIQGTAQHIVLSKNVIHDIENNINADSNAHGIAAYGTGTTAATAIQNLLIEDNELYSLQLGASEAMVVNGNVTGFTIQRNHIHDCNNIAIDAIGFEGTSAVAAFDQARDGLISLNLIERIDSRGNPFYGNDRSADGIYIDGGKQITIDHNTISHVNIGIEVASEHAGKLATEIKVTSNNISACHTVGMSFGGYSKKVGGTRDCVITNNFLHGNDTDNNGNGEVMFQYLVQHNTFEHNELRSTSQNILISNAFKTTVGNTVDFNTYLSPGGPDDSVWTWNNVEYDDFATYQAKTGNDQHSKSASN